MSGTYVNLLYHIIFSTKHREPMILEAFKDELHAYLGGVLRDERGRLLCIGGTADHVHLLALISPATAVSEILRWLKGNSSTWINKARKLPSRFSWQEGYGAFTVSESVKPDVMDYISKQKIHHQKQNFQDEFRAFLRKHHVEYDERYIWK